MRLIEGFLLALLLGQGQFSFCREVDPLDFLADSAITELRSLPAFRFVGTILRLKPVNLQAKLLQEQIPTILGEYSNALVTLTRSPLDNGTYRRQIAHIEFSKSNGGLCRLTYEIDLTIHEGISVEVEQFRSNKTGCGFEAGMSMGN